MRKARIFDAPFGKREQLISTDVNLVYLFVALRTEPEPEIPVSNSLPRSGSCFSPFLRLLFSSQLAATSTLTQFPPHPKIQTTSMSLSERLLSSFLFHF